MRVQAFYKRFSQLLALRWLAGIAGRDRQICGPHRVADPALLTMSPDGGLPGDVIIVQHEDESLRERCHAAGIPLFLSPLPTAHWRRILAMHWPWVWMAAPWGVYGTFVKVFDSGVLLMGPEGSGKSDVALSLIDRGHAVVADDGPEIHADPHCGLVGRCPNGFEGLMEVHGLGIVNVMELFGHDSHLPAWPLDLILRLSLSFQARDVVSHEVCYGSYAMGGRSVPVIDLPVGRNRDMGLVAETAVRLHRAKQLGRLDDSERTAARR